MNKWYPNTRKEYRNVYYYGKQNKRIPENLDITGSIKRLKSGEWYWTVYKEFDHNPFGVLPTKKLAFEEVENRVIRNEILGD